MTAVSRPDGIIGLVQDKEATVMKKNRTKQPSQNTELPRPASRSPLRERGMDPRAELLDVVLAEGFAGVMEMLEEDRERLCGPRRLWRTEREAYRHGYGAG